MLAEARKNDQTTEDTSLGESRGWAELHGQDAQINRLLSFVYC